MRLLWFVLAVLSTGAIAQSIDELIAKLPQCAVSLASTVLAMT
jgi:hypothetical protein